MSQVVLHRAKAINGWMSDAELTFLAETAQKSQVIFEIGSFIGRSTRALADNAPSNARIFAIDPWSGNNYNGNEFSIIFNVDQDTMNMFYCNLADHIKTNKVIMMPKTWDAAQPMCMADFIFIDGDHRYESVKRDICKAMSYLKAGGVIAGHDYYPPGWPGVVKAVDEIFGTVNLVDTIWWRKTYE